MDSPLLYLALCSMRNRLRVRLRRLREPRYLIGSVVGIAYFVLILWRPFSRRRAAPPGGPSGGAAGVVDLLGRSPAGQLGATALLFVVVAVAWVWPSHRRPALAFTRADVQFLFTAPIPRWRLVRYKVMRSQLAGAFGSALVTLFMRPTSLIQGWTFFIGLSLTMAVLNLHFTGVSLTQVRPSDPGRWAFVRRWLPRAIVLLAVAILTRDLMTHWPEVAAAAEPAGRGVGTEVARITASGMSGIVLWPFRTLVRLPLADSASAFAATLPWTLLALGLNYLWLLRTDVPFEEASAELSERLARVRTEGVKALRTSRPVATPFRLASQGSLETAILWKNLISMGRFASWSSLLRFAPMVLVLAFVLARGGRGGNNQARMDALTAISMMVAAVCVLLGPQLARADLRHDLPNLATLRTWPLRGATLVRGEVLAPAVVLVAIAWVALCAAAIFSTQASASRQIADVWAYLAAALAVTPGLILVQLLVQNALAVTFPSWVSVGPPRGGVDVMGQRMLMMVASFLALAITLLPPAILAVVLAFVLRLFTGEFPVVLPGLLAAAVLLGEALIGSELIGQILDRTDVSALDPSDG